MPLPLQDGDPKIGLPEWNAVIGVVNALETAVASKAPTLTPRTQQAGTAYTFALTDAGTVVEFTAVSTVAATVPAATTVNLPIDSSIIVRQYGPGQVVLTPAPGVNLLSRGGALKLSGQYAEAVLTKRAANEFIVSGDVIV